LDFCWLWRQSLARQLIYKAHMRTGSVVVPIHQQITIDPEHFRAIQQRKGDSHV
jgi:hypothetical protein